jgi:predicted ester cyclase
VAWTATELVERFYNLVWNKADETEARRILARDFRFRGSLGPELHGPDGFIAYMRSVHAALGGFTCQIEEVIAAGDQAAARMSFYGRHRGRFFGIEPSGREIRWSGAAFFKTRGGTIIGLWVLGDIEEVRRQLEPQRAAPIFQL